MNARFIAQAPAERVAVSPGEAAKLIGVGRTKIYELISSGALRSVKVGARRLITMTALQEWISSLESNADAS